MSEREVERILRGDEMTRCPSCHSEVPLIAFLVGEPGERPHVCDDSYHPPEARPHAEWCYCNGEYVDPTCRVAGQMVEAT